MSDLRNCSQCGKVFVRINRNICPDCMDKEEHEYEEVRKYLKDNPGASVMEIAEVTGVHEDKILKWMREGRIDAIYRGDGVITCKRCGASITAGNLCAKCAQSLASQFKSAASAVAPREEKPETDDGAKNKGMFVAERLRNED